MIDLAVGGQETFLPAVQFRLCDEETPRVTDTRLATPVKRARHYYSTLAEKLVVSHVG